MDPVSHSALGYALTAAPARHLATTRRATAAGVLGALSPDIDLVLAPTGWDRYLAVHEAGTHSAVGAVFCGCLAACVVWLFVRQPYRTLATFGIIGALSHVAFDLASGATIRLGWPFLDARLQNVGVYAMADPVIVLSSTLGLTGMLVSRRQRQRVAVLFLTGLLLLVAGKTILRVQAESVFVERVRHRAPAADYLLTPVFASPSRWHVYDRTASHVRAWTVDAWSGQTMLDLEVPLIHASGRAGLDDPARVAAFVERSREWDTVTNFRRAHDFTFAQLEITGEVWRVLWSDVRYCRKAGDQVMCSVQAGGEVTNNRLELIVTVGELMQRR